MIRQAAAVVVALCLGTLPLSAQTPATLKVSAATADVHKSPSAGSPVIGKAQRGAELAVTREVGDWVKVSWPAAADGVGYVRARMGTIARGGTAPTGTRAAAPPARAAAALPPVRTPAQVPASTADPTPTPAPASPAAPSRPGAVTPPSAPTPARTLNVARSRALGVGLTGGSTAGFGASARMWSKGALGAQLDVSRSSLDSLDFLSRATSTDISPAILFAMRDHASDRLSWRPYVGLAGRVIHSSRTDLIFLDTTETATTLGARVFLGTEISFSNLPQLGLSADIGYDHRPEPFVGFDSGGIGFSVSGHWYVK